ncbi:MAG: lycopene cyclase domain-containing protein [Myxococcota bacterium]|nr:lycopene cyclase domain-containing protein [Myxococcota bacterium]
MTYAFLVLCGFLAIPGAVILLLRADLRRPLLLMGAVALPFALTERFFYPDYWEPVFLFNLAARIGFGIEDFLFVFGLAVLTTGVYPFCLRQTYRAIAYRDVRSIVQRVGMMIGSALVLSVACVLIGVALIWGSAVIMIGFAIVIWFKRPDLAVPGLIGAGLSCLAYGGICLALDATLPEVFELSWHTDRFSNVFIIGIPLEELLYATSAGMIGTVFYPFVWSKEFVPKG